jgi:hypothetical protein
VFVFLWRESAVCGWFGETCRDAAKGGWPLAVCLFCGVRVPCVVGLATHVVELGRVAGRWLCVFCGVRVPCVVGLVSHVVKLRRVNGPRLCLFGAMFSVRTCICVCM